MATIKKEELIKIIHKGYDAALDNCFDSKALYAKGFLDGMKFQKDGTIPKGNLNKALEKETPESWNKFLDEQGEQKPVFEMKTPEESLGIDSETYNKIVDECVYGEQKHTDKIESRQEELTEFEKAVKQVMEEAIECGDTHNLKADTDMLLRLVQKPWGEEDERFLNVAINILNSSKVYTKSPDKYEDTINWLNSIKDRYTWRPSDEQIEALLKLEEMHVLEHENNQENAHLYMVVKSIREQLLKLRKE